jgi:opacity protein-like surface antigen
MKRLLALVALSATLLGTNVAAQATGMPSFNAPYRAFTRSEIGIALSFPNGGGTAFEGVYRRSSGRFDIGFRGGILDPGGAGSTLLLVGAEARQRVLSHTPDFPLDGALILGVGGAFVSGNSAMFVPIGLSLGRRIDPQGSQISIVPYVQPTGLLVAGNGNSDFLFALGLGADFRLSPRFDARISAGLGDLEGVSISAVWVH